MVRRGDAGEDERAPMGDGKRHPRGERPADTAEPGLCPQCGRPVAVMDALVYHGHVYHPDCVIPGGRMRGPNRAPR